MIGVPVRNQAVRNAAAMGRRGDNMLAHITPGEVVIPRSAQTPSLMAHFAQNMNKVGANPAAYMAGSRMPSVNPATGLQEFADPQQPSPINANNAVSVGSHFLPDNFLGTGNFLNNVTGSIDKFGQQYLGLGSGMGSAPLDATGTPAADMINASLLEQGGTAAGAETTAADLAAANTMSASELGAVGGEGTLAGTAGLSGVLGAGGLGFMAGQYLGPSLFGGSAVGSGIGGGLGAAAGMAFGGEAAAALGLQLGAAAGPVGAVAGALIGMAIGGLFGGGGEHHQGGTGVISVGSDGRLTSGDVHADNYDPGAVAAYGQNYVSNVNKFLDHYDVKLKGGTPFAYGIGPASPQDTWGTMTSHLMDNGASFDTGNSDLNSKLANAIKTSTPAPTLGAMLGTLGTDLTRWRNQAAAPPAPSTIDWANYGTPGTTEQVLNNNSQFTAKSGPAPIGLGGV